MQAYLECPECGQVHTTTSLKVFGDYRRSIEQKALSHTLVCHTCGSVFMIGKYRSASKLILRSPMSGAYLSHSVTGTPGKHLGGSFERNETAIVCLIREIREETGVIFNLNLVDLSQFTCIGRILQFGHEWHNTYIYLASDAANEYILDNLKPNYERDHVTQWESLDKFTDISITQAQLYLHHLDGSIPLTNASVQLKKPLWK